MDDIRYIMLSNNAMNLIKANTLPGYDFKQTAEQMPDGRWKCPLSEELCERIESVKMLNETISDAIERVLATSKGAN